MGPMAYTQEQLATMLAEVQGAISKILSSGEEYDVGAGMSLRRARLADLHAREKWLLDEQARLIAAASGGNKTLARFGRPR